VGVGLHGEQDAGPALGVEGAVVQGDPVVGAGAGDVGEIGDAVAVEVHQAGRLFAVDQPRPGDVGPQLVIRDVPARQVVEHHREAREGHVDRRRRVGAHDVAVGQSNVVGAGAGVGAGGVGQAEGVAGLVADDVRQVGGQGLPPGVGPHGAGRVGDDLVRHDEGQLVVEVGAGGAVGAGRLAEQAGCQGDGMPRIGADAGGQRADVDVGVELPSRVALVEVGRGLDVGDGGGDDNLDVDCERLVRPLHERQDVLLQLDEVVEVCLPVAVVIDAERLEVQVGSGGQGGGAGGQVRPGV